MGNACAGSREKFDEHKEKAKVQFEKARTYSKAKYGEYKEQYGPTIKEKYEEAKMKMQSYRPEKVDDTSQTSMITKFEEIIPLRRMTIDEYERRIKKLAEPDSKDVLTHAQIIESFKDIYPDIE